MELHAQLAALRQIRPSQLPPEEADRAWELLLALAEQLWADQQVLRAEQQALRTRIAVLEGELARQRQGKGRGKGGKGGRSGGGPGTGGGSATEKSADSSTAPQTDRSSERERQEAEGRKPWEKRGKLADLPIDADVLREMSAAQLPLDAVFVRFEPYVVQDVIVQRWNTRFLRARYASETTGKSYLAPLPPGYRGHFGPGVRNLAVTLGYGANVTMPLLQRFLRQVGCDISAGQVSRLLTTTVEAFVVEAREAIRTAVACQPWLQIDDTRSGVRTEHGCCHVLGNDLASYYVTTDRGNRRSVIEALSLGEPLTFRVDALAQEALEAWRVPQWVRARLASLADGAPATEGEFCRWLDLRLPTLSTEVREKALTAAALAGYHAQTEVPQVEALHSDDAAVFRDLIGQHSLCWIHDFRHYLDLKPERPLQTRQLQQYKRRYWKLYRRLLAYRKQPTEKARAAIGRDFDRLVDPEKAPPFLAECIARTRKNQAKLLLVLEHPELPLHNNARELDVRRRVQKRKISFGPVSDLGRQAWDVFQSLAATTEKLGVSFWSYLEDRIHQRGEIPPLSEVIQQRAAADPRPSSWAAT